MKLSTHSLNKASQTQNKNIVTLVLDSVLRLWAFVTLVGVVAFVGATKVFSSTSKVFPARIIIIIIMILIDNYCPLSVLTCNAGEART